MSNPGRTGGYYDRWARGHYKIQCYALWQESLINQGPIFFFSNDQKNEPDSGLHDKICGYHFYTYIWLIILFSMEKIKPTAAGAPGPGG